MKIVIHVIPTLTQQKIKNAFQKIKFMMMKKDSKHLVHLENIMIKEYVNFVQKFYQIAKNVHLNHNVMNAQGDSC